MIGNFGPSKPLGQSNPLSYCMLSGLDSGFMHTLGSGSDLLSHNGSQCQLFMAQYCSNNPKGWDGVCEYMSQDTNRSYPNTVQQCNGPSGSCFGSGLGNALTKGQILIRNTAQEKYLKGMSSNCTRVYEPFDPTVADSPLVSRWQPGGDQSCMSAGNCNASNKCIPIYGVDEKTIDTDPVMNKLLDQPWIGMDILVNIHNIANSTGTIHKLKGTRLHDFFQTKNFQSIVKSQMYH